LVLIVSQLLLWAATIALAAVLFFFWAVDRVLAVPILTAIKVYQIVLSPVLGGACRFHPTCSVYTFSAVMRYGVLIGCLLGAFRICRCQPLCCGGFDPP